MGVPSFKIFMNNRGGEGKRLGLPDIDDGFLFRLCEAAAEHGGLVCPHPENIEAAWVLRDRLMAQDPDGSGGLAAWNASRPPFLEADAVQRAGLFARQTGARLYIVHTSSRLALEEGRRARDAGTDITIETCPHYLTHAVDWPRGDVGKINPPLRERADCEALWDGIADGVVDTVATDHIHRDLSAQAGRHLEGVARLPGHRHAAAGAAERRPSQAQAAARPHRRSRGARAGARDGAVAPQGAHRGRARRRSRDRRRARPNTRRAPRRLHSSAGYSIYEGVPLRGRVRHTLVRRTLRAARPRAGGGCGRNRAALLPRDAA